jgi:hypothetical protein
LFGELRRQVLEHVDGLGLICTRVQQAARFLEPHGFNVQSSRGSWVTLERQKYATSNQPGRTGPKPCSPNWTACRWRSESKPSTRSGCGCTRHSPFADEPVDCVQWVRGEQVEANDYNPNSVATPEMKLLELSIDADGFTQPIVTHREQEESHVVVDGFHRQKIGKKQGPIRKRLHWLPAGGFDQKRARGNGRPDRRHHPSQPRSRCLFRAADDRHRGQASADRMD